MGELGTKTPVHSNDHVNMSQSSNDSFPTAIAAFSGHPFTSAPNKFAAQGSLDTIVTASSALRASAVALMQCSDLLLMLGTDFPYRQFYPSEAKIVQIDIRVEKLGNRVPLTMGLAGDLKTTISALLPRLNNRSDGTYLDKAIHHNQSARAGLDELAVGHAGHKPIHPQIFDQAPEQSRRGRCVLTCDVGTRRSERPISEDNWKAAPHRFLQPRFDGKRAAASNRRTGRICWPPSDFDVW